MSRDWNIQSEKPELGTVKINIEEKNNENFQILALLKNGAEGIAPIDIVFDSEGCVISTSEDIRIDRIPLFVLADGQWIKTRQATIGAKQRREIGIGISDLATLVRTSDLKERRVYAHIKVTRKDGLGGSSQARMLLELDDAAPSLTFSVTPVEDETDQHLALIDFEPEYPSFHGGKVTVKVSGELSPATPFNENPVQYKSSVITQTCEAEFPFRGTLPVRLDLMTLGRSNEQQINSGIGNLSFVANLILKFQGGSTAAPTQTIPTNKKLDFLPRLNIGLKSSAIRAIVLPSTQTPRLTALLPRDKNSLLKIGCSSLSGKPRYDIKLEYEGQDICKADIKFESPGNHDIDLPLDLSTPAQDFLKGLTRAALLKGWITETIADGATNTRRVAQFEIEFNLEPPQRTGTLCVDFGTTAIALYLELDKTNAQAIPFAAILTDFFDTDRSKPLAVYGDQARTQFESLIDSTISLSSEHNFRARFDPAVMEPYTGRFSGSQDELKKYVAQEDVVLRRLIRHSRRFDVSIPHMPLSELKDNLDRVITAPKLELLNFDSGTKVLKKTSDRRRYQREQATGPAGTAVQALADPAAEVHIDVEELLADIMRELVDCFIMGHVARSVLKERLGWSEDDHRRLRLVLTHPCGISDKAKGAYESAARQMLMRLDRGNLPDPTKSEPKRPHFDIGDSIKLVCEPEAAAQWAISKSRKADGQVYRLVAIDMGGGTLDVSVMGCNGGTITEVFDQYAMLFGGNDLDRRLLDFVQSLIALAWFDARGNEIKFSFKLPLQRLTPDSTPLDCEFLSHFEEEKRVFSSDENNGPFRLWLGTAGRGPDQDYLAEWKTFGKEDEIMLRPTLSETTPKDHSKDLFSLEIRIDNGNKVLLIGRGWLTLDPDEKAKKTLANRMKPTVKAKHESLMSYLTFIGRTIPQQALVVARRDTDVNAEVRWVVTGRAALWWPLREVFDRTFADEKISHILPGTSGSIWPKAEDMKSAVAKGALLFGGKPKFKRPVRPYLLLIQSNNRLTRTDLPDDACEAYVIDWAKLEKSPIVKIRKRYSNLAIIHAISDFNMKKAADWKELPPFTILNNTITLLHDFTVRLHQDGKLFVAETEIVIPTSDVPLLRVPW